MLYDTEEERKWCEKQNISCADFAGCPPGDIDQCITKSRNQEIKPCAFDGDCVKHFGIYCRDKECSDCLFFKNGNCFFDYHCPADFEE